MATNLKQQVLSRTSSPEWLATSARISWLLWLTARRESSPINTKSEATIWKLEAAEYRAVIRQALRALSSEGIEVSQSQKQNVTDTNTPEWLKNSARVSWLLWLTNRRQSFPADPVREAAMWKEEAANYRAVTRKALRALSREGIEISPE